MLTLCCIVVRRWVFVIISKLLKHSINSNHTSQLSTAYLFGIPNRLNIPRYVQVPKQSEHTSLEQSTCRYVHIPASTALNVRTYLLSLHIFRPCFTNPYKCAHLDTNIHCSPKTNSNCSVPICLYVKSLHNLKGSQTILMGSLMLVI